MRIGTDMVEIARIKDPDRLANKILSPKEKEYYEARSNKNEAIAGFFAAKEAFMKATGKGLALAPMNEVEVLHEEEGAPYILFRNKTYSVSISDDGGFAIATALYE